MNVLSKSFLVLLPCTITHVLQYAVKMLIYNKISDITESSIIKMRVSVHAFHTTLLLYIMQWTNEI